MCHYYESLTTPYIYRLISLLAVVYVKFFYWSFSSLFFQDTSSERTTEISNTLACASKYHCSVADNYYKSLTLSPCNIILARMRITSVQTWRSLAYRHNVTVLLFIYLLVMLFAHLCPNLLWKPFYIVPTHWTDSIA